MLEFRQIKQRTTKQLCQLYPQLSIKPNIIKSSSLKSIFKVIQCQPLSMNEFKQCIEEFDSVRADYNQKANVEQREEKLQFVHSILKRTEQYFTACINILEHNEKIRQKYEVLIINEQKQKNYQLKQIKQIVNAGKSVASKTHFMSFLSQNLDKVFEQDEKISTSKPSSLLQIKQVYLPNNPDQYGFVSKIEEDQYLVYNEQIVQKLLIYINSINKINRQASTATSRHQTDIYLDRVGQILSQLCTEDIFRVQDNKFNQILSYVLSFVKDNYSLLQKKKNSSVYHRSQLKDSILRMYYMVFMARNQLEIVKNHLITTMKQDKALLSNTDNINKQKLNQHLTDLDSLKQKIKQIQDYLCDKQENIFKQLFQRKIKKVILVTTEVSYIMTNSRKINKRLAQRITQRQKQKASNNLQNKTQIKSKQNTNKNIRETDTVDNRQRLQIQINQFVLGLAKLQQDIREYQGFVKYEKSSQNYLSTFNKYLRKIQQCQSQFSLLTQRQSKIKRLNIPRLNVPRPNVSRLDQNMKQKLLQLQYTFIVSSKKRQMQEKPAINTIDHKNEVEDDKLSAFSLSSSKISFFQPFQVQQKQIILVRSMQNQNYLPPLGYDELVKTSEDFIINQFAKNQALLETMQDKNNLNIQKLQNLIYQLQNNSSWLLQLTKKPVQQQQPSKNKNQLKNSSKARKDRSKNKRPQQKSAKKSSVKDSQPKKGQRQKQLSLQNQQQNKKRQTLNSLKERLIFIRESLIPQISQSRISRIFQQNIHTDIFQRFVNIIFTYKNKIFTEQFYANAEKYGFSSFIQSRAQFVLAIAKNLKALLQIFNFIRIFSQEKVKFQSCEESTYQILLKAILAQKQIQAYRNQGQDLLKAGKVSRSSINFLEEQIYSPFVNTLKKLLKMQTQSQLLSKQLQKILQNNSQCIKLKSQIRENIYKLTEMVDTIKLQDLQRIIKQKLQNYESLRQYPILNYAKLQKIIKFLRISLSIQANNQNQDIKVKILSYLRKELLDTQKGKSTPLLA